MRMDVTKWQVGGVVLVLLLQSPMILGAFTESVASGAGFLTGAAVGAVAIVLVISLLWRRLFRPAAGRVRTAAGL